ncbi:MAG: PadR family transcriptional regulator [Candidatus Thorarchaeota archaeon]
MWPKQFKFFHEFIDDLRLIFIFNTIKSYTNGMTYYDLTQYGNIPHSKIYRTMKLLEEDGDLIRRDDVSQETGRPKHLYFLSDKGNKRLEELRRKIGEIFEFIKLRFPESDSDLDHTKFLNEATFNIWASPIEFIMQKDISDEEKLVALLEIESDIMKLLEQLHTEKSKLEKKREYNPSKVEEYNE